MAAPIVIKTVGDYHMKIEKKHTFRSQPREGLSLSAAKRMIMDLEFFDSTWNRQAKGITRDYGRIQRHGQWVIVDPATHLIWQEEGSPAKIVYEEAIKYVEELNNNGFANYNNWRLPTLEEAMSLLKPDFESIITNETAMHIDSVFHPDQEDIWTSDKCSPSEIWIVHFKLGTCSLNDVQVVNCVKSFVRAVRTGNRIP